MLLQYPGADGEIRDLRPIVERIRAAGGHAIVAADILALALLSPPGEWGADVVVGSTQRFGVPMGWGGPHAGYLATRDEFKRQMPGRLVGVTVDADGNPAYRLALQTREQHIRREKATSNICTAQVLLAVMAGMYAVYHGPEGIAAIARRVHRLAAILRTGLERLGFRVPTRAFFDTITVVTGERTARIHAEAVALGMNFGRVDDTTIRLSLDETTTPQDVERILLAFAGDDVAFTVAHLDAGAPHALPAALARTSAFLEHPVFRRYRSETEMLRYLRRLADRDLALDRSMIPLGSCTMKLNATSEMVPVTWREFAHMHPFAPRDQAAGYVELVAELEEMICACTGYDAVSLQPNAGSQGEYAGLLVIRAYHAARGEGHRNVCLIPSSAHGTNPASAQMAGMHVVVVACDADGNVDLADLERKAAAHARDLAAIMVTYPSTHGVFEAGITRVCEIVHAHGGQVYVDGANLNALVGVAPPGHFGADVSHLNLHKTFCIPHGGGGPGVGPVAVKAHLAPFLPGHRWLGDGEPARAAPEPPGGAAGAPIGPVAAAPFGSASILPISWMYVTMMGGDRSHRGDGDGDPARELRREAACRALSGAVLGARRPRRPRVHPRPAPAQGGERRRGGGRGQAADGLRLPRADDELPGAGNADDRAHRERVEGGARPLRRRDDRHPRGDPRDRVGPHGPHGQSAQARSAHGGGGERRSVAARLLAPRRRLSDGGAGGLQVLAAGGARRQRLRRSQPVLQLHPGNRCRGRARADAVVAAHRGERPAATGRRPAAAPREPAC